MSNYSDFTSSSYTAMMNEKQNQYRSIINQAERLRRANDGPSREEGMLYINAANICEEIKNINLGQRAVYTQWSQRKMMCEEKVREITEAIAPGVAAHQSAAAAEPAKYATVAAGKASAGAGNQPKAAAKGEPGDPDYVSKNAIKEVAPETIRGWFKPMPGHGLEDVTGMEEQKARLLRDIDNMGWNRIDRALNISPVKGYLFYGPPGGGKTYLIEAFAHEMMEKGFRFIKLVGGEIHASLVGVAEKTVQIAFQEAIDWSPCVLFIDEFDGVCTDRNDPKCESNEKRLTNAFLEAWNTLTDRGRDVIFIGATNYPGMIDAAMMDRLIKIPSPLPSEEERLKYFERNFGKFKLEDSLTYDDMLDATDNYSYRDLNRLSVALNEIIKEQVIKQYEVFDANGEIDKEATDIAADKALESGSVELTRELFFKMRENFPPSEKSRIRMSLAEYEKSISM